MPKNHDTAYYAMRIQARPGSPVEKHWYPQSSLPGLKWPSPKAIAPGIRPDPLEDLMFHGGKVVPQMGFQNIYLGSNADWSTRDITLIDAAITRAMQDRGLNNVMVQYFPGATLSCDALPSMVAGEQKPAQLDEPDVQAKIVELFKAKRIGAKDLGATVFNLILPPGTILKLGTSTSPAGLGGYHGSVHAQLAGGPVTLYYSASVFSQMLADGSQNGIVAFDEPWKNVVATLYHELNEFRTDPDVKDAIQQGENDFLGWMSRSGHECGDQPLTVATALAQVFQEVVASDGGTRLPVQFLYANAVHGAEGPIDRPDTPAARAASAHGGAADSSARSPFDLPFAGAVDKVIRAHLAELDKPGVLSVRPGYQMAGGTLTKKPAIVVTVDRKHDDLAAGDRLPETVGGYAVDVREASPMQRLRATNPQLYQSVAAGAPEHLLPPVFPLERDPRGNSFAELEADAAAARAAKKPKIPYTPPKNEPLDSIEDTFTITCHVSPDAGWLQLQPFLAGVKTSLTVGMYDFTSDHILKTLETTFASKRTLDLVLDHPPKDRTAVQTDEETHDALQGTLGGRLHFAWALEGKDPKAAAFIFASAYHIKVAVRDQSAFWLSSGNWNNSNQPDIDPFNNPAGAKSVLGQSDRDWHVIVQHKGLAALFDAYLKNDLAVAAQHQASDALAAELAALAELAMPEVVAVSRTPEKFFQPKTITAQMKIQPALTPDNYASVILPFINSATQKLYIQLPYITPSSPTSTTDESVLLSLIAAIAKKVRQGLDVRIIMSSFEDTGSLEQLQAAGIDASIIRIQNNLHNKGIIVDSAVVAVGSQNWSAAGVSTNRDATLIISNAEAAQYWEEVFLHDWVNMVNQTQGG
jgi:hypothetical protein